MSPGDAICRAFYCCLAEYGYLVNRKQDLHEMANAVIYQERNRCREDQ